MLHGFWGANAISVWHELACSFFKQSNSFLTCRIFRKPFFLQAGKPLNIIVFRLTALLCQSSWSFNALNQLVICHFLFSTASTKRTSCKVQKNSKQVLTFRMVHHKGDHLVICPTAAKVMAEWQDPLSSPKTWTRTNMTNAKRVRLESLGQGLDLAHRFVDSKQCSVKALTEALQSASFRCFGALVPGTRSIWKTQLTQDPVATKKVDCFYHHLVEHLCSQRSFVSHKCSKRSSPSWHAHQDYQESLAPSQIHTTQFLWAEWLQHFSVEFLSLRIFRWLQQRFVKDLGDYSHSIHRYKLRH